MITNRIQYLSAIGFATVGLAAVSGAASAPGGGGESNAPPAVGRVAQELAQSGAKSVIVFVSGDGKEYVATAGSRRPRVDQRFRIGSVTKTFTATVVLQLVEEGKLRLDGALADYLPGVVPRGDEVTIRHLLQHRSGLANYTDYPSWRAPRSPSRQPIDILRFAGSKPLAFKPGSQVRYSNTNYIALGLVIEKVTGRTYAEELEQRIFRPLGLEHTELPEMWRLPDLHDAGINPNVPWAAGAIVSSVRDLSRFYSALLSGRILSNASLATMKKTIYGAGLGVFATELPCGRAWGHDGLMFPDYETHVSASGGATASPSSRTAVFLDTSRPWGESCSARSLRLPRALDKDARRSRSSASLAPSESSTSRTPTGAGRAGCRSTR
jgi:D-alanyl-D-alanine carboxypeptidase